MCRILQKSFDNVCQSPQATVLLPVVVLLASYAAFHILFSQPSNVELEFGFDLDKVMDLNIVTASRSWEFGATAEALLELRNPELTVFTSESFPGDLPISENGAAVQGLQYIRPSIWTHNSALLTGDEGTYLHRSAVAGLSLICLGCDFCTKW